MAESEYTLIESLFKQGRRTGSLFFLEKCDLEGVSSDMEEDVIQSYADYSSVKIRSKWEVTRVM